MITRTYPLSENGLRWRKGVTLEREGARALVRAEQSESCISVTVLGPEDDRLALAKLIRVQFSRINADFRGLESKELLEVAHYPGEFKSIKTLELDERLGKTTTVETDDAGSIEINKTNELNRISSPHSADRAPDRKRLKLFLSYSHDDERYRDVFRLNLDLLREDGLIDWWYDGRLSPSDDWDTEIRRQLDEADIIVFLVSTPFLSSKYIKGVEMKRALKRRKAKSAELVSVILDNCSWKNRPFTKYQLIQPFGNSVQQRRNHKEAFNEVERQIRELLEAMLGDRNRNP